MQKQSPQLPSPQPLMQLSTAYWDSQTFLTANRLGLCDQLAHGPKSLNQLSTLLAIKERPAGLFLNACVALDIIEPCEQGYQNTLLGDTYLVRGKPTFLGDAFNYSDNLYQYWGNLQQALEQSAPQIPPITYLGEDEKVTHDFVYGMHNRALGDGNVLASLVDLSGSKKMLDLGGGPGTYSALFAMKTPGLKSTVLELPGIAAVARGIIQDMGLQEAVSFVDGDYHTYDYPVGNDVVLMSGTFHRESEHSCQKLIEKAGKALVPGGTMIISDVFTQDSGTETLFATLFGLNMLLTAEDGGVHLDTDVADWMRSAGIVDIEIIPFPLSMPHRVIVGKKRAAS